MVEERQVQGGEGAGNRREGCERLKEKDTRGGLRFGLVPKTFWPREFSCLSPLVASHFLGLKFKLRPHPEGPAWAADPSPLLRLLSSLLARLQAR